MATAGTARTGFPAGVSDLAGPQLLSGPHGSIASSAASANDTPHAATTTKATTSTAIARIR